MKNNLFEFPTASAQSAQCLYKYSNTFVSQPANEIAALKASIAYPILPITNKNTKKVLNLEIITIDFA